MGFISFLQQFCYYWDIFVIVWVVDFSNSFYFSVFTGYFFKIFFDTGWDVILDFFIFIVILQ